MKHGLGRTRVVAAAADGIKIVRDRKIWNLLMPWRRLVSEPAAFSVRDGFQRRLAVHRLGASTSRRWFSVDRLGSSRAAERSFLEGLTLACEGDPDENAA